jgi:hypothetical protein
MSRSPILIAKVFGMSFGIGIAIAFGIGDVGLDAALRQHPG